MALLPACLPASLSLFLSFCPYTLDLSSFLPCSLAWSLVASDHLEGPALEAVCAELSAQAPELLGACNKRQLMQLHQFARGMQLAAPQRLQQLQQHAALRQLLGAAASAWAKECSRPDSKTVSACQADVAATAATGLGLKVLEEANLEGLLGKSIALSLVRDHPV